MTLAEFKAWFEGFTEAIEGAPTPSQWARIKEQVSKITLPPPVILNDPVRLEDPFKWRNPFVTTSYASDKPSNSLVEVSAKLRAEADRLRDEEALN